MYRLANEDLKKGDIIDFFSEKIHDFAIVNQFAMLSEISTGSYIFNIEPRPSTKGKLIRAAGSKAKLLRKYDKYALVAFPSGEKKIIIIIMFCNFRYTF